MTTLWVNGEPRDVPGEVRTVAELLVWLGVPLDGTLVEQNGRALFLRELAAGPVAEGDRFELVRIAAGG